MQQTTMNTKQGSWRSSPSSSKTALYLSPIPATAASPDQRSSRSFSLFSKKSWHKTELMCETKMPDRRKTTLTDVENGVQTEQAPVTKLRQQSSLDTTETSEPAVDLNKVIADELPEPFRKQNFVDFLKSEYAEENMEFYDTVSIYRQKLEEEMTYSATSTQGTYRGRSFVLASPSKAKVKASRSLKPGNSLKLEEAIIKDFIKEGSPKQINISNDTRTKTLENVQEDLATKKPRMTCFDEAMEEVLYLMKAGAFPRFVYRFKTKNLSVVHARNRRRIGYVFITLGLIFSFVHIITGITKYKQGGDVLIGFTNPFVRLLSFLIFFIGFFYLLTGKRGLCPFVAASGKYMSCESHSIFEIYLKNKHSCKLSHKVDDPTLLKCMREEAVTVWIPIWMYTIGLTISMLLLPITILQL